MLEGLKRMRESHVIIHAALGQLTAAFLNDPNLHQKVVTFWPSSGGWSSIIFTKNSPLTPIFQKAMKTLMERGIISQLLAEWEGTRIPQVNDQSTEVTGLKANCILK